MKTRQRNKIFCDTCGLEVTNTQELINHQKTHANAMGKSSNLKEFPCNLCDKILKSKSSQKTHMRLHTKERPFICKYCDKAFSDSSSHRKHERIHTGVKPYICNVCEKAFNQKILLRNHLRVIHAESKTSLDCQIKFNESGDSKDLDYDEKLCSKTCALRHMKTRQQNSIFCETCGLEVTDKQELINHQKMHANATGNSSYSKEFPCLVCEKILKSKSSQKIHMRLHTKERPFVCEYCNKAFADGSTHTKHERIHTGVKPYVCNVCERAFNQKVLLRNHLKVIHAKSKTRLDCQIKFNESEDSQGLNCDEKFFSKTCALRYMKTRQRNKIFCDTCGLEVTNTQELINHQKTHANAMGKSSNLKEFPCDLCDKTLKSKSSHKIHMRLHTKERPFICKYCDKAFSDSSSHRKHERIHTGVKPYICNVCEKAFNQKVLLRNHLRVIHAESKTRLDCQIKFNESEDSQGLDCDEKLFSKTCALRYMKTHQHSRIFCGTCCLEVTDMQELINHQKTHADTMGNSSNLKEFPCNLCDKVFKTKWSQKIHMRFHTGKRPFVCEYCNKAFSDGSTLKKHERIHTGVKPYVCNVCERAFNQKVLLRNHLRVIHAQSQS